MSIDKEILIFLFFAFFYLMENSPIKQAYNELQELINTNPEDLSIYDKFNELRELVHKQIVENIQLLYSDDWKDSSTYQSFLKNGTER
jgi:hypothetical protein